MRILAIETSTTPGSVALADGTSIIAERTLPPDRRTTQTFALAIRDLLELSGWTARQIELIGVTAGPGSFTGLRIGLTAAKAFAYCTRARVVAADTLRVIAEQAPVAAATVVAVLNAQRQELFSATFHRDEFGQLQFDVKSHLTNLNDWRGSLPSGSTLIGEGLRIVGPGDIADFFVAPEEYWCPKARTVAKLAMLDASGGTTHDFWTLSPTYIRTSAAEEKRRL